MEKLFISSGLEYRKNYSTLHTKEKYKFMLESINEVIWEIDLSTQNLKIVGRWKDFSGYKNGEITNMKDFADKIIVPEDRERIKEELDKYLMGNLIYFSIEFRIKTKYGDKRWILVKGKTIKIINDAKKFMIGSFDDITDKKKAEDQILFMAYHDLLTNLPNSAYFSDELKKIIHKSIDSQKKGAVMFIDVDNFKNINDSFNHNYGDVLLKIIAELLKFCVKDYGIVARMGGDEFLILVPEIINKRYLKNICELIIENFQNPFEVKDIQTYITVSIGIVIFQGDAADENEILKDADIAVHYAKNKGKNNCIFYDNVLEDAYTKKKIIENGLQKALDNNELELYYQPQVDINSEKIIGIEALLRWTSPEFGNIPPNEFIKVAEESALMYKIGEWVLKEACMQAKKWKDKGYLFDTISVNISPMQIKNNYFLDLINDTLLENNLSSECLEIEITEGT